MYIGPMDQRGLAYLAEIAVKWLLESQLSQLKSQLSVVVQPEGSVLIEAHGLGVTAAELKQGLDVFRGAFSGDLLIVNALSEWLVGRIHEGSTITQLRYECGQHQETQVVAGETQTHGLSLHFLPDRTLFNQALNANHQPNWHTERLLFFLRQLAFLIPSATITFTDQRRADAPQVLHFPDGVADLARELVAGREAVHAMAITGVGERFGVRVELALYFTHAQPLWKNYANLVYLGNDGSPLTGLRQGLSRTIASWMKKTGRHFEPKKAKLGVTSVVSVWLESPMFSGPCRNCLDNPEVVRAVWAVAAEVVNAHFTAHPDDANEILSGLL